MFSSRTVVRTVVYLVCKAAGWYSDPEASWRDAKDIT